MPRSKKKKNKNLTSLTESFYAELEEVELEEGKSRPKGVIMQFTAKVAHAGRVTANGNLYRKSMMREQIKRIQPNLAKRRVTGLCGHPTFGPADPAKQEFIVTGLSMNESGEIRMSADIPDTSLGRDLRGLIRAGTCVTFSQRGFGKRQPLKLEDKDSSVAVENPEWIGKEINDIKEYRLDTFDRVIGPACNDAELDDYNEQKKESEEEGDEMEFDLDNLTEHNWRTIENSDRVKAFIDTQVESKTKEYTKTDEFKDLMAMRIKEDDEFKKALGESEELRKLEKENAEKMEELQKKLDEALKRNAELEAEIKGIKEAEEAAKKLAEDNAKRDEIYTKVLEKENDTLKTMVLDHLGLKAPSVEEAQEACEKALEKFKEYASKFTNYEKPAAGKGKVDPSDADEDRVNESDDSDQDESFKEFMNA